MQFPYTKMETNGHSWILIQDETIDKSISLKTLAKTICHVEYGVGGDGIIVIDHAYRLVPTAKGYNKDGEYIKIKDEALRIAATHLMNIYDQPHLQLNVEGNIYPILRNQNKQSVMVSYKLPESHTEKTLYNDKTPILTYSTNDNQTYIIMNHKEITANQETISKLLRKHTNHTGCFIEQNTSISFTLRSLNGNTLFRNLTDEDICSVIAILRNKNKLMTNSIIDFDIFNGRVQVIFNYDTIHLFSKVHKISHGNYYYSTHSSDAFH